MSKLTDMEKWWREAFWAFTAVGWFELGRWIADILINVNAFGFHWWAAIGCYAVMLAVRYGPMAREGR